MPDRAKHLLLVEDEPHLREAVAEQLTDRGFHVRQAESGESALSQLSDFAFDMGMSRPLLKFGGGSVEILRDVGD